MKFNEIELVLNEGSKFKKAVAAALLGASLASGIHANENVIKRTRRASNNGWYEQNVKEHLLDEYKWVKKRLEEKNYSKGSIDEVSTCGGEFYIRTPYIGEYILDDKETARKKYEEWEKRDKEIAEKMQRQEEEKIKREKENKIKLEKRLKELESILNIK